MRRVIFTDLDGTFIDFEIYSPGPALAVAKALLDSGDLVVFCSSKTRFEQMALMEDFQFRVPAVVENGSGLYLPPDCSWFGHQGTLLSDGGRLIAWGIGRNEIQLILDKVEAKESIDLRRYAHLSDEELVVLSGLDIQSAGRARQRDFSETLTAPLNESASQRLNNLLEPYGLHCACGGRFHTETSIKCNKGKALELVLEEIRTHSKDQWQSVAIGDSANDFPMLKAAQHSFLVKQHTGGWARAADSSWTKVPAIGPEGFAAAFC